jgi:RNA polymerase sigma-70 factor, ECF subfamily
MAPGDQPNDDSGARGPVADEDAVARDSFLLDRVRRGDMDAYGELVARHARRAYSIAYGILRHREDAEDVVQESFARTLERIERIDAGRPFHPWFYRIVVNTAINLRRTRSRRAAETLRDDVRSTTPQPDRAAEVGQLRDRLLRALDALPERQRTIVLLADVEELTSMEIAEIMAMPAGTVRYHLHLARRALRHLLPVPDEEAR